MRRMKSKVMLVPGTILAIITLVIIGCSVDDSVSIEERAQKFMRDLDRNDWSTLYTHIHPDEWRSLARSEDTWTPAPFADGDYKYDQITVASSEATVRLSGTPAGVFDAGDLLRLHMRKDGEVWYIRRIDRNGTQLLPP